MKQKKSSDLRDWFPPKDCQCKLHSNPVLFVLKNSLNLIALFFQKALSLLKACQSPTISINFVVSFEVQVTLTLAFGSEVELDGLDFEEDGLLSSATTWTDWEESWKIKIVRK